MTKQNHRSQIAIAAAMVLGVALLPASAFAQARRTPAAGPGTRPPAEPTRVPPLHRAIRIRRVACGCTFGWAAAVYLT